MRQEEAQMTKGTYDWSVCLLSLMEWSLELGPIPAPHLPYGGATAPMLGKAGGRLRFWLPPLNPHPDGA